MNTIVLAVAKTLAAELGPIVLKWLAEEVLPKILEEVGDSLEKNLPAVTAALVSAVADSAAKFASEGVDKVTDLIPGQLDDKVLDPIIKQGLDIFKQLRGGLGL